jgi:hypothetical protein
MTTGSKAPVLKHQMLVLLSRPLPARGRLIRWFFEQITPSAIVRNSQTRWSLRIVPTLMSEPFNGEASSLQREQDEEKS